MPCGCGPSTLVVSMSPERTGGGFGGSSGKTPSGWMPLMCRCTSSSFLRSRMVSASAVVRAKVPAKRFSLCRRVRVRVRVRVRGRVRVGVRVGVRVRVRVGVRVLARPSGRVGAGVRAQRRLSAHLGEGGARGGRRKSEGRGRRGGGGGGVEVGVGWLRPPRLHARYEA